MLTILSAKFGYLDIEMFIIIYIHASILSTKSCYAKINDHVTFENDEIVKLVMDNFLTVLHCSK